MTDAQGLRRTGLLLGISAYLAWGVLPLFFKAIGRIDSVEIVAHRVLWSLPFLALLLTLGGRWPAIRTAFGSRRALVILLATSALIAVNWLVFIYAIVDGHVLEASLGYYLNPLVNVLLGVILLKERLSRAQSFATLLAGAGVAVLAVGAGAGLWISLALAISFSLYGFLRKIAPVDALEGLSIETVILTPFALGWILWLARSGSVGFGHYGLRTDVLVAFGGVITATPLLLFTAAARRLPYSMLGFLQYIAPSMQFLLAVAIFGEPLSHAHILCFGAIWTALAIFSVDGLRNAARARSEANAAP